MDREKVMQALDDSLKNQHCGFVDGIGDVYAVSEETIKNIIALLKEQEAVEPQKTPFPDASRSDGSWFYVCGECSKPIDPMDKFCRWCGRAVKWE